MNSVMYIILY